MDVIAEHLDAIRKILRSAVWAEAQRYSVGLTAPQLEALRTVVEHMRDSGGGISLRALSQRMGLAHSTVSGIVSRLETRGVLRRRQRLDDRRSSLIELTPPTLNWVETDLPASRHRPIELALAGATEDEVRAIVTGVELMHRLLVRASERPE